MKSRKALYLGIFALFLFLDQSLKFFTYYSIEKAHWFHHAYPFGGIGLIPSFLGFSLSLTHVENEGAAWGLFASYSDILLLIRMGMFFCLFIYLLLLDEKKQVSFPFFLILIGAAGNIVDYFMYGKVIDMFQVAWYGYRFPVFNFADCLITSGIILLLTLSFWEKWIIQKAP